MNFISVSLGWVFYKMLGVGVNNKCLKAGLIGSLIFACGASAGQEAAELEPLAMANIKCAAFYLAAQQLVKPEFKKEYEAKFGRHYEFIYKFTDSYEVLANALNDEMARQLIEAMSIKEQAQVVSFLSKGSVDCTVVEAISVSALENNTQPPRVRP
ncbi:hypothetical protein ACUYGA_05975 [Metapseudomonas otitidis]|uniref:hypothetical protein n=1 Tax=Metapseudomonas otitidis TaxID=319939 RepID=UPI0040555F34